MKYWLIVYDVQAQRRISTRRFVDREVAMRAYTRAERAHQGRRGINVVLLGADSIETLKVTHANYFGPVPSIKELVADALGHG